MKNSSLFEKYAESSLTRRDFMKTSAAFLVGINVPGALTLLKSSNATGKIVIIGGGAAGMSMAARLTQALEKPDITLVDPSDSQFYQPGFTLIASGVYDPSEVVRSQKSFIPSGVNWIRQKAIALDPEKKKITLSNLQTIEYDYLVLTPGLELNFDLVEGITRERLGQGNAHCIYDYEGAKRTWDGIRDFAKKGGNALFTDTYTKHKCGGAPKKIALLTEHYLRKKNNRAQAALDFFTASGKLYDVPHFTPRLEEIFREREIPVHTRHRLKGIDTERREVYLEEEVKRVVNRPDPISGEMEQAEETVFQPIRKSYDFLHFVPPMSAPAFIREAGLSITTGKNSAEGWADVDKHTLIHRRYSNIVCLGDCAGLPTSKTSAAIRMQVPIALNNLIDTMEGRTPSSIYDGYAACPIITEYGKVLLCEFDYEKNPKPSIPLLDTSREQALAWMLKVYMLKPMYFYGMLNGWA